MDRRVPVRTLNFAWHRFGWPPVERLAGPADVAHSAHPLLMPAARAAQAVTIHDLDFLEHPERTSREIRRDYPRLARAHAQRAHLVVVSSESTAKLVSNFLGVPDNRLVVCPAGAPEWALRVATAAPRAREYFLFVGTLEPRKNVGVLLAAYERLLARLPSAPPLRLAGKSEFQGETLLQQIGRPPLAGRVTHLGYVSADVKPQIYAAARALVIPSLHEGFGLTALEAMSAGVPVIASRRGSLPEVLGDAAMFVDPEDPESIARAMEKVATDENAARALASAGARRAALFSWPRSAATLRRAYDAAVQRRRGTP